MNGVFKLDIRDPEGAHHVAQGPGSDGFLFALHMLVAYEGSTVDPGDDKLHQLGKAYLEEATRTIARLRAESDRERPQPQPRRKRVARKSL